MIEKLFTKLFHNRIQKYVSWESYEIGFTGNGPTAFDIKPKFNKPKLPKFIESKIKAESKTIADMRKYAFKQSCIDVLGEDPMDWV